MMSSNHDLILASNSPRRRQLLSLTGWEFDSQPADLDESLLAGEDPASYVIRLAVCKAKVVAGKIVGKSIVVAADTTVADGDAVLGKPESAEQAKSMLRGLRGHSHKVYTGLAVCDGCQENLISDLCMTEVPMRNYSDVEVEAYVDSGDPLDKAGAYAIQHPVFQPVERIQGCYASVMGLPLCHLQRSLAQLGLKTIRNIQAECQQALNYDCPVWQSILKNEGTG